MAKASQPGERHARPPRARRRRRTAPGSAPAAWVGAAGHDADRSRESASLPSLPAGPVTGMGRRVPACRRTLASCGDLQRRAKGTALCTGPLGAGETVQTQCLSSASYCEERSGDK